jgi:transcriptional regulator with XRE-family HTH domain
MTIEIPANSTYHYRLHGQVRREIARLNISQNGLARAVGLSSGYMSQLLSGKRFAGPETPHRLMEIIKLSFDELFEEVILLAQVDAKTTC